MILAYARPYAQPSVRAGRRAEEPRLSDPGPSLRAMTIWPESLDADLRTLCGHLGIEPPAVVPHANASRSGDYRTHFTPAMRDRVAELHGRDLEVFGYTFD